MIHWMTSPATTAKKQTKRDSFRTAHSAGRSLMATTTITSTFADDCLEEESVDSYYNAKKYGY